MLDLVELEKMKDYKEVNDIINEVNELRQLYFTLQFEKMYVFIQKLMNKYMKETIIWNSYNTCLPQTYKDLYNNAESFLEFQYKNFILKKAINTINK